MQHAIYPTLLHLGRDVTFSLQIFFVRKIFALFVHRFKSQQFAQPQKFLDHGNLTADVDAQKKKKVLRVKLTQHCKPQEPVKLVGKGES